MAFINPRLALSLKVKKKELSLCILNVVSVAHNLFSKCWIGWLKNVFLFDLNSFVDGIHILKAGTEGKEKKPSLWNAFIILVSYVSKAPLHFDAFWSSYRGSTRFFYCFQQHLMTLHQITSISLYLEAMSYIHAHQL